MFETICDLVPRDRDYPSRTRMLDILARVLDGRTYDPLPYQFHTERGAGGEYIPLRPVLERLREQGAATSRLPRDSGPPATPDRPATP